MVRYRVQFRSQPARRCVDGTINDPREREVANVCIDISMSGLEDGKIRMYRSTAPSITAREYKDPRMILETSNEKNWNNTV